jgi:hypothetical protein
MPTIEITEKQCERLEDVRTGLEEHRVGPYGIVRPVDAVEFLLDQYEADIDSVSETPAREGVGRLKSEGEGSAGTGDAGGGPGSAGGGDEDESVNAGGGLKGVSEDEPGGLTRETENEPEDTGEKPEGSEGQTGGGGYEGSEAGRLDAMMRLLEEYDDKWEESGAEGGKYMVTLPDGSQEGVRTKDDVRALLFKHY